jgi:preprotein translocase subunit Sss1
MHEIHSLSKEIDEKKKVAQEAIRKCRMMLRRARKSTRL